MDGYVILAFLVGLFALAGGAFNWNWFMEHRKAQFITRVLGNRQRARIFYVLFGVAFIVWGILGYLGIANLNP